MATSGDSKVICSWLSRGGSESPERLENHTSVPLAHHLPAQDCRSYPLPLEQRLAPAEGIVVGGNVPYFLGGMEQKKACNELLTTRVVRREYGV